MDETKVDPGDLLAKFARKGKFRPGNQQHRSGSGRGRGKGTFITKAHTRKEERKQKRKDKKAGKHKFFLAKSGKIPDSNEKNAKGKKGNKNQQVQNKNKVGKVQSPAQVERKKSDNQNKTPKSKKFDHAKRLREEEDELKKDMEEIRRKRLREDNEEEDRYINQLQKKLKLNKKAIIPASFRTDGLDYLLEVCQSKTAKKKKAKNAEEDLKYDSEASDEFDKVDNKRKTNSDGSESSDDFEDEMGESDDEILPEDSDPEGFDSDEEEPTEIHKNKTTNDKKQVKGKQAKPESESSDDEEDEDDMESGISSAEEDGSDVDYDTPAENSDGEENSKLDQKLPKSKPKKEKKSTIWEDIYGRLRNKDGSIVDSKSVTKEDPKSSSSSALGKYVPPMKRGNDTKRDKIMKSLKGLLNRLSESNMHNISQQIEELYMTNSRNEMNESMLELINSSLVRSVVISERIIMEHSMLITILHANVGTEIGAFFIQNFVQTFRSKYDEVDNLEDNKELQNLILLISCIYHFKIVDCSLIYDILDFLAETFTSKDVELILVILRSVGFRLRKDDPAALKTLILLLQQKANKAKTEELTSRVKFMMEILIAIRNNNMTKIPNYDPSFGEHLLKILKVHLHKGNYISEMKITMKDLLSADTKGRWWIVGSAWTNTENSKSEETGEDNSAKLEVKKYNQELLSKAKAQGMNTETRRNIFCILMTAEDYLDAFEKLCRLGLKNQLEREIIFVVVYCCLQEKKFNLYYALIATKFCSVDRKHMYSSKFKLEAIEYAKLIGQRATSRFLEVSQRRIFEWINSMQKIMEDIDPSNPTKISDFGSILKYATPTALIPEKDNLIAVTQSETTSGGKTSTIVKKAAATYVPSYETENNESESPKCNSSVTSTALEADEPVQIVNNKTNSNNFSTRSLKQILDVGVESEVFNWVQSLLPSKATSSQIRDKARELYREKGFTKIQCSYGWYRRWTDRFKQSSDPHGDTDPMILAWLLQQYDNNIQVSYADLQKYGQTIVAEYKPNFKASLGWAIRFFKRHHIFINWDGYYEENLPPILQDKVEEYITRLRNIVIHGFPLSRIGCMDEIPLSFSSSGAGRNGNSQLLSLFPPANNSFADVCEIKMPRSRKVTIKNCDATVLMGLLADGTLLPPLIIIKQEKLSVTNRAFVSKDKPVVVFYSETTEPSQMALQKWMDMIWIPNVRCGPQSLLLWDSYEVHQKASHLFQQRSIQTEMFPDGCACKLQPLGVFAKVAFMKFMDGHWQNYLNKNSSGPGIKLPSTNEVISWIYDSYCTMKTENSGRLRESFQIVGLLDKIELTG